MVAYTFQADFVPLIQARTKQQTIRRPRKRHARPGEALQFMTGPRMKPIRIGYAACSAVRLVRLDFVANRITLDDTIDVADLDAFAIADGFGFGPDTSGDVMPWTRLRRWWAITHPGHDIFDGVLVQWGDSWRAEA